MTTPPPQKGRQRTDQRRRDEQRGRARAMRDLGLQRVTRLTSWIVVGAIALTGGLSEVAAHALPGRSSSGTASRQARGNRDQSASAPAVADDQGSDLQPPEQAPAPSPAPPAVVSGGS